MTEIYGKTLEAKKDSDIDFMSTEDLRGELRAVIKMLDAERKFTQELQKRLIEVLRLQLPLCVPDRAGMPLFQTAVGGVLFLE